MFQHWHDLLNIFITEIYTSRVNNVIMIKTKVLLPQTYVTLPILAILFRPFGFIALKMPFQPFDVKRT